MTQLNTLSVVEEWLKEGAKWLTVFGVTRDNVRNFLQESIKEARKYDISENAFVYALNDAFLEAKIALKDFPLIWHGGRFTKTSGVAEIEVEIEGLGEPIVAEA